MSANELREIARIISVQAPNDPVDFTPEQTAAILAALADAERWQFYACPQTALMLGSKLDPNDQTIDWLAECNKLADARRAP